MAENLTKFQKKFLSIYHQCGSISEAAALCGIPKKDAADTALKIFSHPKAKAYIAEIDTAVKGVNENTDSVEACLDRIVNGRANDAVVLAKSNPDELSEEDIQKLDLYGVSEMKFSKGVCEIKFADKIKAAEKLNEIRSCRAVDNAAQSFFDAIGNAAENTE